MRNVRFIALVLASAASLGVALPAQAQVGRANVPGRVQLPAGPARSPCTQSFADSRCAVYQSRVIKAVWVAAASSPKRLSVVDVNNRQLDALIASVN